jgi:tetratricopeptide (TPR) repeat protein
MEELHRRFPDHVEVATFYALAKLGTVDPTDKSYARQRVAGDLLEPLFQANPDHPGIAHYIIHAYDYPELADRALHAARRYDDIAPWVPHALHMPTHIYTRLGMWEDSIEGNLASSEAARNHAKRYYNGGSTMDDLHAMDYLMFAYQQTARDSEARTLLEHIKEIREIVPGNDFASAYAIAAMPARDCVERKDWQEAIGLEVPHREFVERFPFAVAHVEFARAVGAARSGELEIAGRTVRELARLRDSVDDPKFLWWNGQIEIQHLAAGGWLAHARGRHSEAEELFRKAAAIEDAAGTHPVTPGQILPVREQLGEMLLEIGKPTEALAEFERSLEAFPRRFHSHVGAARAASRIGRHDSAREHASALIAMAGEKGERPGLLAEMRAILEHTVSRKSDGPLSDALQPGHRGRNDQASGLLNQAFPSPAGVESQ